MALVLLTSCARTPCGHVEPAEDSRRQVGTDVLSFTGQVPKNLLFISIDTLRRDHLGAHGDLGLTPFLDRLADEGVVMQDHMQCSNWTYGAITCTLLGSPFSFRRIGINSLTDVP